MFKGIEHIGIYSNDTAALKNWYIEMFGFKQTKIASSFDIPYAFMNRDILITQYVYLSAIKEFIKNGGGSRGSYLIKDKAGRLPINTLPEQFRFSLDIGNLLDSTCEIQLETESGTYTCKYDWLPVRPIPSDDNWFENVWNDYMKGNIIK